MEAATVKEHHAGPTVARAAGWFKVFEGKAQRRRESGVFGQAAGEDVALAGVGDDDPDALAANQGQEFGEVAGRGVGGFGGTAREDRPGDPQAIAFREVAQVGMLGHEIAPIRRQGREQPAELFVDALDLLNILIIRYFY
jgi:hypothetical protein